MLATVPNELMFIGVTSLALPVLATALFAPRFNPTKIQHIGWSLSPAGSPPVLQTKHVMLETLFPYPDAKRPRLKLFGTSDGAFCLTTGDWNTRIAASGDVL